MCPEMGVTRCHDRLDSSRPMGYDWHEVVETWSLRKTTTVMICLWIGCFPPVPAYYAILDTESFHRE